MRPLTVERHTYQNIKETGYFTINQVHTEIHKQAHQTSASYPSEVSEFDACGFTEEYINEFPAPFVKDCRLKIGLSYEEEHPIKANHTILLIGRVRYLFIPDEFISKKGAIDFESMQTVGVGGLNDYYSCKHLGEYSFARP